MADRHTTNEEDKRRLARVFRVLEVPMLVAVPLALGIVAAFQIDQAALLTLVVVIASLAIFLAGFDLSRPALRQILPTAVLAAIAAAGRILFFAFPNFKPVCAICILAGVTFGRRSGFMTGALAALVSNFFFGQGAWTPWQMYAWGLVGYLAGVLADHGLFERVASDGVLRSRNVVLCLFGAASSFVTGFLLNTWTWVGFIRPLTVETALLTYGAGLTFDVVQAIATVIFLLLIYIPWRRKLERIKVKYALAEVGSPASLSADSSESSSVRPSAGLS